MPLRRFWTKEARLSFTTQALPKSAALVVARACVQFRVRAVRSVGGGRSEPPACTPKPFFYGVVNVAFRYGHDLYKPFRVPRSAYSPISHLPAPEAGRRIAPVQPADLYDLGHAKSWPVRRV